MEDLDLASLRAEMEETPTCASAITASLGATAAVHSQLLWFMASNSRQHDAVKLLKEYIAEITATVMQLSESKKPSSAAKWWMADARDLSYRIHDYFDSIMCSGAEADAQKIRRFEDRSKEAIERLDRYNIIDLQTFCRRLPAIHADIIHRGRTDELAKKLDIENEKKLKVVPIVGPEGVGKTMLAKSIYRKIGRNFECRAFVRVSPDPDMRKLLTSIFIQIQREPASRIWDAQDLIEKITEYLQNKRYLLVIDDLWTTVVWDIIRRAFPDGDCSSRIVTTTQIEDVALECCSKPEDEFKMIPLNVALQSQDLFDWRKKSQNLFFRTVYGFEGDCSQVFQEVLRGIMRNFPSATINITFLHEQWRELMKEVVKLLYNNLPPHLKACLLYLTMYPEDYVIRKDELVKQWLAEGFICEVTRQDRVQIAGCYFDELASRGMIQPVDKKYNKVLSCTVHRMVRELIACKCKEQNFVTCLDYCQSNVSLLNEKIHRLSVQFGGSKGADIPECIRVAEVRSFAFFGFFECLPSIEEFNLLRVLVLHIWGDTDQESLDLTGIGELSRLRYLKIVCNIMVTLPTEIRGLKCLETLEIDANEATLPGDIQYITSLHTLGYFDLSTNSIKEVMDLPKLVNLQDLHLTCSILEDEHLKKLSLILEQHSNLEYLTLAPTGPSHAKPRDISCDVLGSVSPASAHLQRLELSRRYCIFSHLPEWTKDLSKLCILKIAVKVLSPEEIVVLGGLSALTALSLYVQTTIAEEIVLDEKGFRVLTYFKFICDAPHLSFRKGAMPNVRKLVLGINPNRTGQYDPACVGIRHLSGLKEISAKIASVGGDESDTRAAESALEAAFIKHPSSPFVSVQRVDWIFDIDNADVHQWTRNKRTTRSNSGTPVASETSSPEQIIDEDMMQKAMRRTSVLNMDSASGSKTVADLRGKPQSPLTSPDLQPETKTEVKEAASQQNDGMQVASSSLLASTKIRDATNPEIMDDDDAVPTSAASVMGYTPIDTHKYRLRQELKGEFVVGLAKSVLEAALAQAKSAIVLEEKLRQRAQLDLMFIVDEFENMRSLLEVVDEERAKDIVVKTWVRQIQEMAYYVDDHMELIIDMGKKSRRWRRRRGLNPCMAATTLPPDDKGARIAQIKARVEDVSRRIAPNNSLVRVSSSKTVDLQQQQTAPTGTAAGSDAALSMLVEGRGVTTTQQRLLCDLTQLLTRTDDDDLQVFSLWGACGDDLGRISIIRELYTDPEVCNQFESRAWVKLTHPFDPIEFIRCLLAQFYATNDVEERLLAAGQAILRIMEDPGQLIFEKLVDHVYSNRYLVVLEDLSTMPQWDIIRSFLPDGKNGSRIIVSSKEFEIASLCVGQPLQVAQLMQFSTKHSVYAFHKEYRLGDRDKGGVTDQGYANGDTISSGHEIVLYKKEAADDWMKNDSPLVGRESQIGELREYVASARVKAFHVMSVWGVPGVGKSALVRNSFYQIKHGAKIFERYGWVDVSHPFNLRDFSRSILRNFRSERDPNPIQECHKFLQQYRCLIVIDNLESKEDWDLIQDALVPRPCKSFIIVITSERSTATYCADSLELVFNIKGLDATAALDLLKNEVSKKNPEMASDMISADDNAVIHKLIFKCGGLPKVIVAIAGLLATKKNSWMQTASSISDKFMEYLQTIQEFDGLGGLFCRMNSFFQKCPDFLMPYILYLSVFPGSHIIRRRRLVRRWIAEGYSRDSHERSSEEEGENIFCVLHDLSIIKPAVFNDTSMTLCQVNGFIHEYIISRQMEENLHVFKLGGGCALTTKRTGRHLIISEDWDRDSIVFNNIDFSILRSLTVFGKWQSFFVSKGMKLLRVLDLEGASGVTDDDLEEILMHLRRLKFLSLRGCSEIHHLPGSLGGLRQLQTLDIRHTSIRSIPANTTKLQKLQYIRAGTTAAIPPHSSKLNRRRPRIGVKVPSEFGKLTMLHTLGVVNVRSSRRRDILNEIKKLTQLHKLGVSGINRSNSKEFFSAISDHVHLESLSVQIDTDNQDCLENIPLPNPTEQVSRALENLQSLKLYGLSIELPEWCGQLTRVRKIHLEMATLMQRGIVQLGRLPQLAVLGLRLTGPMVDSLHFRILVDGVEDRSYEKVKILKICSCKSLDLTFGLETMENLEILEVDCNIRPTICDLSSNLNYLRGLKEILLKGYYDSTVEVYLKDQLAAHPNQPVLKLGEDPGDHSQDQE